MSLDHILNDLAGHVQHLIDEGETTVEMNPNLLRALRQPSGGVPQPQRAAAPTTTRASPQAPPPSPRTAPLITPATAGAAPYAQFGSTPQLDAIAARIAACQNCTLCQKRTQVVPGQGNPHPELVFVGEGPGEDEDLQGLAFVGRAGQLLTRMILAMGLAREEVWIGNVVKCRPPGNRAPAPEEMDACLPYLREQLTQLKPKVIVALGATAVKGLLNVPTGITKLRGQWLQFEGIDLMPTFHPSYLLRGGGEGKARYWEVWEDLCAVLQKLGRPVPERKPGKS